MEKSISRSFQFQYFLVPNISYKSTSHSAYGHLWFISERVHIAHTVLLTNNLITLNTFNTFNNIVQQIESFSQNGSGWVVDELINIDISIINIDPLK